MDGTDPDELLHAATIAGLIQQMSPRGTASHPGQPGPGKRQQHLCAHHCQRTDVKRHNLDPPIDATGNLANIDVPADVSASINAGLATVQAFAQNSRTIVLVSASGDWQMAKPMFDYLTGLSGGWRDLTGDVLVTGQGANPQTITVRADGPVPLAENPGNAWRKWAWLSLGVVGLSAILIGFYLLRRRSPRDAT